MPRSSNRWAGVGLVRSTMCRVGRQQPALFQHRPSRFTPVRARPRHRRTARSPRRCRAASCAPGAIWLPLGVGDSGRSRASSAGESVSQFLPRWIGRSTVRRETSGTTFSTSESCARCCRTRGLFTAFAIHATPVTPYANFLDGPVALTNSLTCSPHADAPERHGRPVDYRLYALMAYWDTGVGCPVRSPSVTQGSRDQEATTRVLHEARFIPWDDGSRSDLQRSARDLRRDDQRARRRQQIYQGSVGDQAVARVENV